MSSVIRSAPRLAKAISGGGVKAQPDQQFLTCMDNEPYCFQKSDIDALLSSGFLKVSDSLYIAQTRGHLNSVLNSLNNLDDYWFDDEEYTAVDMGKTIRIGLAFGDNDIITMRLVKRTGNLKGLGTPVRLPNVCYIVTGNKMGQQYNNALYCGVSGTTPNNRSKKPFINNGGNNPCIVSIATFESIFASTLKVSGSLYLARTVAEFRNVLDSLNDSSNYDEMSSNELSSIDLGKTIHFGIVGVDNDLLVFRLVKRTGNVLGLGSPNNNPNVGYICIASKINQEDGVGGDPEGAGEPQITGTSPNALEVKPQSLSNCGYEPALFPEADLQSILADCVNVSGGLYLAKTASQLASVCGTLDNWSGRDYLNAEAASSIDMGKTIRLGLVGGESDLITFASTKGDSSNGNGDNQSTGYVVVASKLSQDYNDALYVSILGSAPRDS